MNIKEYIEQRNKELNESFRAFEPFNDGLLAVKADLIKDFHTASLEGLLDIIEEWAEKNLINEDYVITAETAYGVNKTINDLRTFIGRDTK